MKNSERLILETGSLNYWMKIALLLLLPVFATAQEIPPGGQAFIAENAFRTASFYSQPGVAARNWVEAEEAWRITIEGPGQNFWDSELGMRNSVEASAGEVALVVFNMRAVETTREDSTAWCTFYAQYPEQNYDKDVLLVVSAGTQWRTFFIPIQFSREAAVNKMAFVFGFGADPGVLEISGFQVLYYGNDIPFEELPQTRITYDGMEPDAPWRAEAAARIEAHRRGDFTLRVLDDSGNPLQGASITAIQRDHAFDFGTAIAFWRLFDESPDGVQYRATLRDLFNAGSNENALKAPAWQGEWGSSAYGRQVGLDGLVWMRENGLRARGHVMVWPGWSNLPQNIQSLRGTAQQDQIPERVLTHIRDIADATDGWVQEWDVLNEPVTNHDLMDLFGEQIMDDWFNTAAEALEPGTILYLNDYALLSGGGRNTEKISTIYDIIQGFIERDVPIGGLGLQGHFAGDLTAPDRLVEILDQYASLGLDLRVTEFDVDITDRELQAQYLRDFYTVLFSHPSVVGIQMWGFWEGSHWRPDGALYNLDWSPRPAADAYQELVWEEWMTEASGTTDESGQFAFRGTFGEYEVTIKHGESTTVHTVFLTQDGALLQLADKTSLSSQPEIHVDSGGIQLSWLSPENSYQRLETSTDFLEWKRSEEFFANPGGPVNIFTRESLPDSGNRFYRLVENAAGPD